MSLLLVKPDKLGDFILAVPALRAIRQSMPTEEITLVVGPEAAPLAMRLPYYDKLLVGQRKGKFLECNELDDFYQVGALLRYDADYYNAAAMFGDRCKIAVTWDREVTPWKAERNDANWHNQFTTWLMPDDDIVHEVIRNLELAQCLTGDSYEIDTPLGLPFMREWGKLIESKLVVVPGAGEAKRQMPLTWARMFHGYDPLFVGAPHERELLETFALEADGTVYTGPLVSSMGHVALADKVVTMDSGMSHVAAAYGRDHLCIVNGWDLTPGSPNDPKRFGPWSPNSKTVVVVDELDPALMKQFLEAN